MIQRISKFIMKLLGWKITGNYPYQLKKKLIIGAPHTSNWDFIIGVLVKGALQDDLKYIGKASLFRPPLGWIMKALGGMPLEENKSISLVQKVVNLYGNNENLTIAMSPEGQRKKTDRFRTGYYYIAKGAKIPVLPVHLDFGNKRFHFLDPFYPSDETEKDLAYIESLFVGIEGYRPEDGL